MLVMPRIQAADAINDVLCGLIDFLGRFISILDEEFPAMHSQEFVILGVVILGVRETKARIVVGDILTQDEEDASIACFEVRLMFWFQIFTQVKEITFHIDVLLTRLQLHLKNHPLTSLLLAHHFLTRERIHFVCGNFG